MSQRTQKKCWLTLQVASVCAVVLLQACSLANQKPTSEPQLHERELHETVGLSAKSLTYVESISTVGVGSNDLIKRMIAGDDLQTLQRPVAIDVRGDTMIIADSGYISQHRGMSVLPMNDSLADAGLRMEDKGSSAIYRYNFKTKRIKQLWGAGEYVVGDVSDVYLASDFSFYVTDIDGRRALHFSPNGSLLKIYKHPPNIFRPIAITVDEQRKQVLIADETYSHIVSFDMDKAKPIYGMGGRGTGPGKFRIITDMIPIPDGYLVSDRIELRVQVLDSEGNYVANFGQGIVTFPTALARDKYGRIYVSDKADSTIKVFKAGKLVDQIGTNGYGAGEFRNITDMKVKDDQLYVVDSLNGRIQIFDFVPDNSVAQVRH